jgi:hypothetical protein
MLLKMFTFNKGVRIMLRIRSDDKLLVAGITLHGKSEYSRAEILSIFVFLGVKSQSF